MLEAAWLLGWVKLDAAKAALKEALADPSSKVREMAAASLKGLEDE